MAEVATNESMKVVSTSSKNCEEACGVKSNNGLIDLGNVTTSSNDHARLINFGKEEPSNNMKIATNVAREDKTLEELIENELALRISSYPSSSSSIGEEIVPRVMEIGNNETIESHRSSDSEMTKIIRERGTRNPREQEEGENDINSAFIISEMNHCNLVRDDPLYSRRNGREEEQKKNVNENVNENVAENGKEEEEEEEEEINDSSSSRITETISVTTDLDPDSDRYADLLRTEQFSDNVYESLRQISIPSNLESLESDGPLLDSTSTREIEEPSKTNEERTYDINETRRTRVETDPFISILERNGTERGADLEILEEDQREDIRDMIERVIGELIEDAEERATSIKLETERESISNEYEREDHRESSPFANESPLRLNNDANNTTIDIIPIITDTTDDTTPVNTTTTASTTTTTTTNTTSTDNLDRIVDRCSMETRFPSETRELDESWTSVGRAIISERFNEDIIDDSFTESMGDPNLPLANNLRVDSEHLAPLATSDDDITDVSNKCDVVHIESHDATVLTTGTTVVTTTSTSSTKTSKTTKTKKKKIEGVTSGDASPGLTPKTKKTKKSKKSDSEKENISVKTSSNKFDALGKKTVLHVRSVDAGKVQQQFNTGTQNGEPNPNCRSCGKVVFQMEQMKAEGSIWHKNCFRCNQCSKQLNVDNYQSHETTLYCKAHFRELFQPKPVEESDQPIRPRKPELIIRENQPTELPPDVVRASDKPDLGLEELASLNVKSRFQVFEKANVESNDIERSSSQVAVKRSPSILSKLAKFQAKGMDIGVADDSLNGIPFEESSESEEEDDEDEEAESEIVKAKRTVRERPMSFSKMDDMKNRWESTSQQGRREYQREARKEEIAGIRSRLFMGKQGKMKELYQQAVAESERITKVNAADEIQEIQQSAHAKSIKARFERGEPISAHEEDSEEKSKYQECPDEEVIAAGISKKSRSIFLELDATAAKTARPVTPVGPRASNNEVSRRARDAFMGRQVSDDVVRSSDTTEEVRVETTDISNKFKFFETYKAPETQRRQFRITPPRDGQVKMESPEREIYRDPEVVRAEDRVDDVMRTDTARKMLSIFRQMEENATKEDIPDGPKPLKRFTPPPEDKFAKATASESENEEEEDGDESGAEDNTGEHDPNYVRASDKVEDEFLKQSQNAARAKTLRAKFEHWEVETDGKNVHANVAEMEIAQGAGEQSSIESASSLRARFESLGSQTTETPRTPKVKVNRFVGIQSTNLEVCESCEKKVYPLEKVETNNKIFHKQCFRCLQCNCVLRMDTFTLNNGRLYCIPHFKQLFIARGNYDEGFGIDPHKNKWSASNAGPTTMPLATNSPTPITVSNGDA